MLSAVRRELKRVSPDVRIEIEQIRHVVLQEVIKRDVVEGEKFGAAEKALTRAAAKAIRSKKTEGAELVNATPSAQDGVEAVPPVKPVD